MADFTFLPMRSRASDVRTVSTSGSSGIAAPIPRGQCGLGLGDLLGLALSGAAQLSRDRDGCLEGHLVRGAVGSDVVDRHAVPAGLGPFPQSRLGIDVVGTESRRRHVLAERHLARKRAWS